MGGLQRTRRRRKTREQRQRVALAPGTPPWIVDCTVAGRHGECWWGLVGNVSSSHATVTSAWPASPCWASPASLKHRGWSLPCWGDSPRLRAPVPAPVPASSSAGPACNRNCRAPTAYSLPLPSPQRIATSAHARRAGTHEPPRPLLAVPSPSRSGLGYVSFNLTQYPRHPSTTLLCVDGCCCSRTPDTPAAPWRCRVSAHGRLLRHAHHPRPLLTRHLPRVSVTIPYLVGSRCWLPTQGLEVESPLEHRVSSRARQERASSPERLST